MADNDQLIMSDMTLADQVEIFPPEGGPSFTATGAALFALSGFAHCVQELFWFRPCGAWPGGRSLIPQKTILAQCAPGWRGIIIVCSGRCP